MKKSAAVSAVLTVPLLTLLTLPAISRENGTATISGYCAAHDDLGLSHGACVAYLETNNIVPHDASICRLESIQRFLGVANHGQCMKKLAEIRK